MMRVYDGLIRGLANLAGLLIAGVCLLIVWDVVARNLGLTPPASTLAITEYVLLYFTMAAAPSLVRDRGHIVVTVFYQRCPESIKPWLDRFVLLLCALICAIVTTLATWLLLEAWARGEIDVRSMDTPRWVLFVPLSLGFALMTTEFLRLLWRGESVSNADEASETF